MDSFPFSFTRIQDKNPCNDVSNEINNVFRELKQIKKNIAKEIHVTRNMNNNLTTRIHSFMEACNLVLKDFDRQPEHEIDYSASYEYKQQQNIDDGKKERTKTAMNLERTSSLQNKFQTRERLLSTTSCGSSVRFDLSQNEFFD